MKVKFKSAGRPMQVVLGSQTIKAFVAAPKEFKVIGIVRMGMEFGLLAVTGAGTYVRVNGSTVEPLSCAAVEAAILVACSTGRGQSYAATRMQRAAEQQPKVVIRQRRRLAPDVVTRAVPALVGARGSTTGRPIQESARTR